MNDERKQELLDLALERAAESLGDIRDKVYDKLYRLHPEVEAQFEDLRYGTRDNLEGNMIEQVLYCLMHWYDRPAEIQIMLSSTLPHHATTLMVKPGHFMELITIVFAELKAAASSVSSDAEFDPLDDVYKSLIALCEKFS